MATIKILYRSTKEKAFLTLQFFHRHKTNNYKLEVKTKIQVSKDYWNNEHNFTAFKKTKDVKELNAQTELKAKQIGIKKEITDLQDKILKEFFAGNPDEIAKDWLQNLVNPPIEIKPEPEPERPSTELIKYFDIYTNKTKPPLKPNTKKKCNVIKKMVLGFEKYENIVLDLKDVDPDFQERFESYCNIEKYAPNTVATALKFIRTICNNASYKGLEVSTRLKGITITNTKVESIYLSFAELEQINNTILSDSLNNAKDWLIISCYLGQRVSDFMRFDKSMIRTEKGVQLLEFTQQKTEKIMTIPLHKKVREILIKRNGNFPYSISDQKYNDHIKKVCQIAGLTKKVKGSKKLETAKGSGIYRKETKVFEKWELVTSHIGRRSLCTNFYGILDNTDIMYISGHSTEELLNIYLGKSNKSKAIKIANLDAFN